MVSVVMPIFNGEKYLAEAIESILDQTFTDFEFIIIDDGSQDSSAEIVQTYAARDKRINFLKLHRNKGTAAACNLAIAKFRGQYFTRMDCDDISLPERLEKQVDFLQSHLEIGALGANRRVVNHDLSTILYPHILSQQHALIALDWFISPMFMGATLMLRRDFLLAVGGFSDRVIDSADTELVSRLLGETPVRFANLFDVLYLHRRHERNIDKSAGTLAYSSNEAIRMSIFKRLWNDAPNEAFERISQLRRSVKLSWAERRATKRDLLKLVDALIDSRWVEPSDQDLLLNAIDRRLEQTCPRLWQQFCHWYRFRIHRGANFINLANIGVFDDRESRN